MYFCNRDLQGQLLFRIGLNEVLNHLPSETSAAGVSEARPIGRVMRRNVLLMDGMPSTVATGHCLHDLLSILRQANGRQGGRMELVAGRDGLG